METMVARLDRADETELQKSGATKQATRGPVNVFKEGDNPYKDKKNVLTEGQLKKRQRMIRHVKRNK